MVCNDFLMKVESLPASVDLCNGGIRFVDAGNDCVKVRVEVILYCLKSLFEEGQFIFGRDLVLYVFNLISHGIVTNIVLFSNSMCVFDTMRYRAKK